MKLLSKMTSLDNIEDGDTRKLLTTDDLFPIGAVYTTSMSTLDPSSFLTGNWQRVGNQVINNNSIFYWVRKSESTNLIDLTSAATTLWDERTTHGVTDTDAITINVTGSWARVACSISGLEPSTTYDLTGHIINTDGLSCGFYTSAGYATGTSTDMTKTLTLISDSSGNLYVEFSANLGDTVDTGTVIFNNLTLYPAPSLYPNQNEVTQTDGFVVTFKDRYIFITGQNTWGSVWGWTEQFTMNLTPNNTYSFLLTNTNGSIDDSARVAQDDGVVCKFSLTGYDSQGNQTTLFNSDRKKDGLLQKYFFTPTAAYNKYSISTQAKKLNIFSNWTCDISIEKESEVYPVNPTIEQGSINSSGQEESSSSYCRTGFIPVKDVYKLSLSNTGAVTMRITCYDENKDHIASWNSGYGYRNITGGSGSIDDFSENCRYIRMRLSSGDTTNVVTLNYND